MKLTYKLALAISAAAFVLAIVYYTTDGGQAGPPQAADAQTAKTAPAPRLTLRSDSPDSGSLASVSAKAQAADDPGQAGNTRAKNIRERIQTAMADSTPTQGPAGEEPKKNTGSTQTTTASTGGIALVRTDRSAPLATESTAPADKPTAHTETDVPQTGHQKPPVSHPIPTVPPTRPVPSGPTQAKTYTVKPRDTFSSIAISQYNDEQHWLDIAQANPLVDPTRLKVGQVLRLPDKSTFSTPGTPGSTGSTDEPVPRAPDGVKTYKIRPGDSLSTVAEKYYDDPTLWRTIYNFNRDKIGPNPNAIQAGMILKVPPRVRGAQ
jgi:nucleoid-associated protein YgaU